VTVHPFIEAEKTAGHNVKRVCELLKVSRAAFYARRTGTPGPRAERWSDEPDAPCSSCAATTGRA
jgi:putative transposase